MTTNALRLRACPRCEERLWPQRDQHGGYWLCVKCGHHSYQDVPPEARIARPEAAKAYYSVFDYSGANEDFMGLRLRGRVLPKVDRQYFERFEIGCPFMNCSQHMRYKHTGRLYWRGAGWKTYVCRNKHRIVLNVQDLSWE